MKIIFKKLNAASHELKLIRADHSSDTTILNTATYQLHDICHFFVERELKTLEGFWGMLAQGYKFEQLSGKTNKLTEKLRLIECIVGAVQSVYSKHMSVSSFWNQMATLDWAFSDDLFLEKAILDITEFMEKWKYLPVGTETHLTFALSNFK